MPWLAITGYSTRMCRAIFILFFRIAVDGMKTSMGLPEVMLGVLPGGGGTQRLPSLTGLPNSLDMALTGKTLNAKKAKKVLVFCGLPTGGIC